MTALPEAGRGLDAALGGASREIEAMGYGKARESRRESGRQGLCAVMATDGAPVVVKWFDPARPGDVDAAARDEFCALEELHAALDGLAAPECARRLYAPRPLACATAVPAFLMEYAPGTTLDN